MRINNNFSATVKGFQNNLRNVNSINKHSGTTKIADFLNRKQENDSLRKLSGTEKMLLKLKEENSGDLEVYEAFMELQDDAYNMLTVRKGEIKRFEELTSERDRINSSLSELLSDSVSQGTTLTGDEIDGLQLQPQDLLVASDDSLSNVQVVETISKSSQNSPNPIIADLQEELTKINEKISNFIDGTNGIQDDIKENHMINYQHLNIDFFKPQKDVDYLERTEENFIEKTEKSIEKFHNRLDIMDDVMNDYFGGSDKLDIIGDLYNSLLFMEEHMSENKSTAIDIVMDNDLIDSDSAYGRIYDMLDDGVSYREIEDKIRYDREYFTYDEMVLRA